MPHGRVIWTYGRYTPPNHQNARLPAWVISRLIAPRTTPQARAICRCATRLASAYNFNSRSETQLHRASRTYEAYKHKHPAPAPAPSLHARAHNAQWRFFLIVAVCWCSAFGRGRWEDAGVHCRFLFNLGNYMHKRKRACACQIHHTPQPPTKRHTRTCSVGWIVNCDDTNMRPIVSFS